MGKPKAKPTSQSETKNKPKNPMNSNSQKLREKKKNKDQIKKAVKNIDNFQNGEHVKLLPEANRAKLKANKKGNLTQEMNKPPLKKQLDNPVENKKPKWTPKVLAESSSTNVVSKEETKLSKKAKKNKVKQVLSPAPHSVKPSTVILNSHSESKVNDKKVKRKHGKEGKEGSLKKSKASSENEKCEYSEIEGRGYSKPSSVEHSTILKAVSALKQLSSGATGKNVLFDDDAPVFLQFTLVKIPNKIVNTAFELPHSLVTATSEVCLITPDLSKGYKKDHESTIEAWTDKLRAANVTKINTVLPFRQLRVEYDQFELKRRLYTQHDFILVDSRVLSHAAHLLGKMFTNGHNKLIPVRISDKDLKKSIDKALKTAILKLKESAFGLISVAHNQMSVDEIVDNIESVVKQLQERFPGGEDNIRALHIKLPTSPAIPIYITLKPNFAVDVPKVMTQTPKAFREYEDELSTYSGDVRVKVMPEGRVFVTREKLQERDDEQEGEATHEGGKKKKKQKLVEQDESVEGGEDLEEVAQEESDEEELEADQDTNEDEDESDDE